LPVPAPVFADASASRLAAFAPDGHSVAFESLASGKSEIYVCAWDGSGPTGDPIPVSEGGGDNPMWSRAGRLYYHTPQNKILSAAVTMTPELRASSPRLEWDLDALQLAELFDLLPDGQLLGMRKGEGGNEITSFDITLNFFDELKRRMAAAKK
jgi:hypothetical protein